MASLYSMVTTDLYIRLCAAGVIQDVRILTRAVGPHWQAAIHGPPELAIRTMDAGGHQQAQWTRVVAGQEA